jgi:hypothetical protein
LKLQEELYENNIDFSSNVAGAAPVKLFLKFISKNIKQHSKNK